MTPAPVTTLAAMQDDTIRGAHVIDGSLGADDLAAECITGATVADSSLTGDDVQDESLTGDDLQDGSIGSTQIGSGAVSTSDIASSAVTSSLIYDGTISTSDIAASAITGSLIYDGTVDTADLDETISLGIASTTAGGLWMYDDSVPNLVLYQGGSASSYDTLGVLVSYYGTSGNKASVMSSSSSSGYGFMGVNADDSSCCAAGMYVDSNGDGIVFGTTKSFVVPHPEDPEKRIVYAAVEGPEAAAYVRGTGRLEGGIAMVELPDHFRLIASPTGMTATLTPTSSDSQGLAVVELTPEYLLVEELGGGTGTYDFYWRVEAVRAGQEDFRVIRDASEFAPANLEAMRDR